MEFFTDSKCFLANYGKVRELRNFGVHRWFPIYSTTICRYSGLHLSLQKKHPYFIIVKHIFDSLIIIATHHSRYVHGVVAKKFMIYNALYDYQITINIILAISAALNM